MSQSIVGNKSVDFAVRIIKLSNYLNDEKREYTISKQIARSGTSIGANVREAKEAQSDADFIHKLSIALKETAETEYWLELLVKANYISQKEYDSLYSDCMELYKLLTSIIKTKKLKMSEKQ